MSRTYSVMSYWGEPTDYDFEPPGEVDNQWLVHSRTATKWELRDWLRTLRATMDDVSFLIFANDKDGCFGGRDR